MCRKWWGYLCGLISQFEATPVGAGLARDGFTAFCLTDRGACIASKPAPTEGEGVVFKASTPSSDKYRTGSICHPAHGSAWARQYTAPCAGA